LKVGASLAERHSGTNAVALALRYREPVILRGHEHFCRVFSDWYSVAAPVVAADGRIVGCVDLSTNRKARLGEKLPLVTTLAVLLGEVMGDPAGDAVPDDGTSKWSIVSPRQRAILRLLAEGRVAKEIALNLCISVRTVESHLEKLRQRFKAKTTVELIVKLLDSTAKRNG
jgi:DNA-binding CsgD family transcriptional regulator